jgi:hypothetical protein
VVARLDGAVLSIDDSANQLAYGAGTTPRMIFEGRVAQAPGEAVVAFRDALEEASALARDRRSADDEPAPRSSTAPAAAPVAPAATDAPSQAQPLAEPAAAGEPVNGGFQDVPADGGTRIEELPR